MQGHIYLCLFNISFQFCKFPLSYICIPTLQNCELRRATCLRTKICEFCACNGQRAGAKHFTKHWQENVQQTRTGNGTFECHRSTFGSAIAAHLGDNTNASALPTGHSYDANRPHTPCHCGRLAVQKRRWTAKQPRKRPQAGAILRFPFVTHFYHQSDICDSAISPMVPPTLL